MLRSLLRQGFSVADLCILVRDASKALGIGIATEGPRDMQCLAAELQLLASNRRPSALDFRLVEPPRALSLSQPRSPMYGVGSVRRCRDTVQRILGPLAFPRPPPGLTSCSGETVCVVLL